MLRFECRLWCLLIISIIGRELLFAFRANGTLKCDGKWRWLFYQFTFTDNWFLIFRDGRACFNRFCCSRPIIDDIFDVVIASRCAYRFRIWFNCEFGYHNGDRYIVPPECAISWYTRPISFLVPLTCRACCVWSNVMTRSFRRSDVICGNWFPINDDNGVFRTPYVEFLRSFTRPDNQNKMLKFTL